ADYDSFWAHLQGSSASIADDAQSPQTSSTPSYPSFFIFFTILTLILNIILQITFTVELIRFRMQPANAFNIYNILNFNSDHLRYIAALLIGFLLCLPFVFIFLSLIGLNSPFFALDNTNSQIAMPTGFNFIIFVAVLLLVGMFSSICACYSYVRGRIGPIECLKACLSNPKDFGKLFVLVSFLWIVSFSLSNLFFRIPSLFNTPLQDSLSLALILGFITNYLAIMINSLIGLLIANIILIWFPQRQGQNR
ncbi:MAG: hypothetical protein AAF403_08605, partial [Pseudomonadota bacterium]